MPIPLVKQAMEQSRGREPVVKAMALLRGARVLAAVDREAAKEAFGEGCALAERLALDPHELESVLCEAVELGASVDPMAAVALFRGLPRGRREFLRDATGRRLTQTLARCGAFETAVELLEDLSCPATGAGIVVQNAPDLALQRRAMAAARERWRLRPQHGRTLPNTSFSGSFRSIGESWRRRIDRVGWRKFCRRLRRNPIRRSMPGSVRWNCVPCATCACSKS